MNNHNHSLSHSHSHDTSSNGGDDTDPFVAAYHQWEFSARHHRNINEEFAKKFQELYTKCHNLENEFEEQKQTVKLWQQQGRRMERELNFYKSAAENGAFAFVIIDGDGAVFDEELIALGEEGGKKAAHELHRRLKQYIQDDCDLHNIDNIFVHVVLNVQGLSSALVQSGTLPTSDYAAVGKFGRGFCRAQPLFSFTDVGGGKEQADHKVRKLFELMEKNIQCKFLALAGCHDNGYATFLESYRNIPKIRLLETTPAAADFRSCNFDRFSIPSVFRSEPVPSKPGSSKPVSNKLATVTTQAMITSPIPKPPSPTSATALRPKAPNVPPSKVPEGSSKSAETSSNGGNSYAAIGKAASSQTFSIAPTKKKPSQQPLFALFNRDDERVDAPLPKADPQVVKRMDEQAKANGANFCNRYHLSPNGTGCKAGDNCSYYHSETKLSKAEILALRHKTRKIVCNNGSYCEDASCNLGHHCQSPVGCFFGSDCRFADFHGMDITPTLRVHEDGTRDVIAN
ncbi:hypothetical protein QBC36DRAFT_240940 [Triangularia setosa]|uniref:C3H1-type domain-containing protein n=1 Tax=Triangularia setosa TaxID=2587417 RepID=A0AAN6W5V2_9PEZI|nr:hypothetical protein QBC36DRAFT_240940 [Podospora setosa]